MPNAKGKLLIVDDAAPVRMSLSAILAGLGYSVRTAEDGFSALAELRREIPDLILSDLNMPGMSGFELLSVVRRRFSIVRVIAMSGSFCGERVPPGVAADAYYEKGSSLGRLLRAVESMTPPGRPHHRDKSSLSAPIWIASNGHDRAGEPYVMISCMECLRTFPQALGKGTSAIREAGCVHCGSRMHYAIVDQQETAHL